jgi:hypothetical protein
MADLVITLVEGSSANVDNFNIYGEPGDHLLASGVTRADLASGYYIGGVDTDTYPTIKVASTGTCTTSVNHDVFPAVTPTATSGTELPQYSFSIAQGGIGDQNQNGSACYNFNVSANITIYSFTAEGDLVDGNTYYDQYGAPFNGHNFYYSDGVNYGRITSQGVWTQYDTCTPAGGGLV